MHYKDTTFSYFPANIKITKPLGEVTLKQMLDGIRSPKPEMVELFAKIAKASAEGDLKLKAELKQKLYYFLICVKTNGLGRSYEHAISWTGLAILDFDNLEPQQALDFQKFLFETYPYIIATCLSSSKRGVKAIVHIEQVESKEEFKAVFYALAAEMEQYEGFDGTAQSCVLAFYLCYSPELLYRDDATVFKGRGYKVGSFKPYEGEIITVEDVSEEDRQEVLGVLQRNFDKITNSGHYTVRAMALYAGGIVASGYFDFEEMEAILHGLIDDTPYLHKSLHTYKTTVTDMLKKGMSSPLTVKRHQ